MILIVIREENSITILSRSSSTLLIMLANSFSESAIMEKKKTVFNKTAANLKQMHHTFGTKLYIREFTFLKKDY